MGWLEKVQLPSKMDLDLQPWQANLVDFLFENGVLKFGNFQLKSKRRSTTFANFGDVNGGEAETRLGEAYAAAVKHYFGDQKIRTIVGPAYKGIPIAVATAMMLARLQNVEIHFTYDRKEEKAYGEATGISREEAAKKLFVGYIPKNGDNVLLVDDVITTGGTKEEEIAKLSSVADVNLIGLLIGLNRQELDENGNDAAKEISEKYKMPVRALLNMSTQVVPYLAKSGKIDEPTQRRVLAYTRTYGTEETKGWCRDLKLIERPKGIIPACDVPLETFEVIVQATADIDGVVAYKIPALSGEEGWKNWVLIARKYTDKTLIYDHQKAGNDIPDTGKDIIKGLKRSGFDAVIMFPFTGPATQWEWTHAAFEQNLEVLLGAEMTHPKFKESEGGYISDNALVRMYVLGAKSGVNNFVVPGNKLDACEFYKSEILKAVPGIKPIFYSPGLVAQGGKISDATKLFDSWYGIVGRGIYGDVDKLGRYFSKDEIRQAALEHVSKL